MQEMNKIDTFVGKIHTQFMNKSRTPEQSMVADLQFSANLMKLAIWNLKNLHNLYQMIDSLKNWTNLKKILLNGDTQQKR